ncbi:MAG: MCE family protein [Acidimicrobiales bacterium]
MTRRWSVALPLGGLVMALSLSGCLFGGGPTISASAVFSDINGLATNAPVEMADVKVGHVSSFRVTGSQARVYLTIDKKAQVPAQVEADISRTSLLGEVFVDLVPKTTEAKSTPLANGAVITNTRVVPGLEQLVKAGTNLVGALSANQLADLINEGAQAFGGKGPELHQLLDYLNTVVAGYNAHTAQITSLVNSLNTLSSSLAPNAQANAQALTNLSHSVKVLNDQSTRLANLLGSLSSLSVQGSSILSAYFPEISNQLNGLRSVTSALAQSQSDLGNLLTYLPIHNTVLPTGIADNFIQILNDFIVCGMPGGGEIPTSPLDSCHYVPQNSP